MKPCLAFALPLFVPVLSLAAPAAAAEIQIQVQGPVVEITAMQVVPGTPDIATISGGVTTRAPTAVAAMQRNAAAMERVIASIRAQGVDARDIQTAGIGLNAHWRHSNQGPPTFVGYDASNRVTVIARKVDRTGQLLDAMVTAGANEIHGPAFSIENDAPQKREARRLALQAAQAQAADYARAAGFASVRLLEINETIMHRRMSAMDAVGQAITVTAARTPIEPGQVGTSVQITAKYEMTR